MFSFLVILAYSFLQDCFSLLMFEFKILVQHINGVEVWYLIWSCWHLYFSFFSLLDVNLLVYVRALSGCMIQCWSSLSCCSMCKFSRSCGCKKVQTLTLPLLYLIVCTSVCGNTFWFLPYIEYKQASSPWINISTKDIVLELL